MLCAVLPGRKGPLGHEIPRVALCFFHHAWGIPKVGAPEHTEVPLLLDPEEGQDPPGPRLGSMEMGSPGCPGRSQSVTQGE